MGAAVEPIIYHKHQVGVVVEISSLHQVEAMVDLAYRKRQVGAVVENSDLHRSHLVVENSGPYHPAHQTLWRLHHQ